MEKYKKIYSIRMGQIFTRYFIYTLIFFAGSRFLYDYIWDEKPQIVFIENWFLKLGVVLLAVVVHELIHGGFAAYFSPNNFKNIKFGVSLKMGAAYMLCRDSFTVRQFMIIAIAPLIILGIIPYIIGFSIGSFELFFLGLVLTIGSVGDIIMFCWLFRENKSYRVREIGLKKLIVKVYSE